MLNLEDVTGPDRIEKEESFICLMNITSRPPVLFFLLSFEDKDKEYLAAPLTNIKSLLNLVLRRNATTPLPNCSLRQHRTHTPFESSLLLQSRRGTAISEGKSIPGAVQPADSVRARPAWELLLG